MGVVFGLCVSPFLTVGGGLLQASLALLFLLVLLIERGRLSVGGTVLVLCAAILLGLVTGAARLAAIDDAALRSEPGSELSLSGFAATAPRASRGVSRFIFDSDRGKVMVEVTGALDHVEPGTGLRVDGVLRRAPDWYRANLDRLGIAMILDAESVARTGSARGGVEGLIDRLRTRAEQALSRAMPKRESALARGFVLGQDQEIDPATVADFQDSNLAHLLAVSGQNVVLLALLAVPFMAIAGIGARARLAVVAGLILLYVPLAGGGPSIQRAGVMGLAGIASLAASRPTSRLYALGLAAAVTLSINPRAAADIGWQLSFAAVIGIAALARPIRRRLAVPVSGRGGVGSAIVDGVAVTVAATLATAPLMAFHFERVPVAGLAANLAALPAVAPAMWLGMVSAAIGQIAVTLAAPFNLVNSLLLSYIAQVAVWFGRPSWAVAETGIATVHGLLIVYAALAAVVVAGLWLTRPGRTGLIAPASGRHGARGRSFGLGIVALIGLVSAVVILLPGEDRRELGSPPEGGARIEILDVGQGDATLIRSDVGDPMLIDGGPPGGGIDAALESAGVERLEAVLLTHADLDHAGGLHDVFERYGVGSMLFDGAPRPLLAQARAAGTDLTRVSEGDQINMGPLAIEVLWPPARAPDFSPPEDRNARSIVLLVSWREFRVLLTGDAEAEAVPIDPGPVDVLKVAHHGSDDAGLPALLSQAGPRLSVISAGKDNRFGHPTDETLAALRAADGRVLRTDLDGTVSLILGGDRIAVETGR